MTKIVEKDRRPEHVRERDELLRSLPRTPAITMPAASIQEAIASLDERRLVWERGFVAGIFFAGLQTETTLARGTRDFVVDPADEPTAPYPVVELDELGGE